MKKYNCPECYELLDTNFFCKNGHHFEEKEGILSLLSHKDKEKLSLFLEKFEDFRAKNKLKITTEAIFPQLPFITNGLAGTSWKARAFDTKFILKELAQNRGLSILEIGAWNGWLSYRLTEAGHKVTAIDIFTDKYDGLGAMQFYPKRWTCLQMNIEMVDKILLATFDVIILNWGAAYIVDLPSYIDKLRILLNKNGKIIFIGVAIYPNSAQKAQELAQINTHYHAEYGINLFFTPCKGYLTWADKQILTKKGFHLRLYPFWRSQLKAVLRWRGALTFYGIAHK